MRTYRVGGRAWWRRPIAILLADLAAALVLVSGAALFLTVAATLYLLLWLLAP